MAAALKKLMQVLGLDDGQGDDPNEVTADMAGLSDDEMGSLRNDQKKREIGMVDAPPERQPGFFVNPEGEPQEASDRAASANMADASRNVETSNRVDREKAVREAMALLGDTAREHNLPGMFPSSPEREGLLKDKEQLGDAFSRAGVNPDDEHAEVTPDNEQAERPAPAQRQPVRSGASVAQKEQLAEAFRRAGVNPETDPAAEQLAARADTESQQQPDKVVQVPVPPSAFADSLPDAKKPGADASGPLGQVSKMVMGSTDPRMTGLREALAKRDRMLRMADAEHNAGSGADIVGDTNFNAHAGEGTRARAEAGVDSAMKQNEEGRKISGEARAQGDYESRQLDSTQRRTFNVNDEQRRGAAEGRAGAKEGREQKTFDVQAGHSDPNSDVSRNRRAEAESLYAAQWKRIPREVRDTFTADDIDALFKEVSAKDFATGLHSGGMQDRFEEKQVQDYNKNRVTDRTVEAVNNLMGRLDDKAPIQGFDAAKGWAQASKVPLLGGLLSGAGNSAVRGTEMEGIAQDAMAIMQQISLDTSGKVLNESEIRNIEKRLGLAAGQGEDAFRRAMSREFDAIQTKADRDYSSFSPGARSRIEQRGLRPRFKSKRPDYAPRENTVLGERAKDLGIGGGSGADLGYGD